MRTARKGWMAFNGLAWLLAGLVLAGTARAQSTDEVAREADTALRNAQNLFFSGKRDEALAALVQGNAKTRELRQLDETDRRLAGFESRVQRLKTDLERRMGGAIDLDSGTLEARPDAPLSSAPPPPARPAPAAAASDRLPYHAEQRLLSARRVFESINGSYSRFDYYLERGEFDSILRSLDRIEESLREEIPEILADARRLAAEKDVSNHADFDEYEARLARETERAAETRRQVLRQSADSAAAGDAVTADVEALATAYDRLRDQVFDRAYGGAIHYNDLVPVTELIEAVEEFEAGDRAPALALLADFAARYGSDRDAINDKVRGLGYSGNRIPGNLYDDFAKAIPNVDRTRTAMGADLLQRAREDLDSLATAHDFYRFERRERVQAYADMAARFDSGSSAIRGFRADLPARFQEDDRAFKARIDGRKWPGSLSGKKAEEEAGLKYFREDSDWGARPKDKEPRVPVAVAITGDWTVQKRDLLNRPVMYGVPAQVAVEVPAEKARQNVLRVYNVTLRTAEGPEIKPAPPFREITVGDSWYIRPGAVK